MKSDTLRAKLMVEVKRLEEEKTALLQIDKVAKRFNEKMMNKRFTDAISSIETLVDSEGYSYSNYGASYYKDGQHHNLMVYKYIGGACRNLLRIYNVERAELVIQNKLVYSKLHEVVMEQIDWRVSEIHKLHEEMETGEQKIAEYNQLVAQLNQMYNSFSSTFKNHASGYLKSVVK